MGIPEIKKYLQSIKRLDTIINSKIEILDMLRQLSNSINGFNENEKVQSSKNNDRMSDIISKIIDLEKEINKDIDRFVDIYKKAESIIGKVENDDCRTLLVLRYLNFRTWEEIAEEMNYSVRHIYRLHGEVLSYLKDKDVIECHY